MLEDRTLLSPTVIATIPFGSSRASTLVTDPGLQRVFVAEEDNHRIAVVDATTNAVLSTVPTAGFHTMDVDPVEHRVYVGQQFAGRVLVIDGVTGSVVTDLTIPDLIQTISYVAVNPATHRLYVVRANNNDVAVMDLTTNSFIGAVAIPAPVGFDSQELAVDAGTNRIYLTNPNSGRLTVIDGASNTVLTTVPISHASSVAVNPGNHHVYIASYPANNVTVLDGTPGSPTENSVLATIPVEAGPAGVAVNPVTGRIYVSNHDSNTVSVIDGATNLVVASVPVSSGPMSIDVVPGLSRIYVGHDNVHEVTVIEDTTPPQTLVSDLAVYYQFNGTGADSSGNSRDVNLFGGVGFAPGLFGEALDLHANNTQFAQRPVDDPVLNFGSGDFTVQIWINYNSLGREETLIEKFFDGGGPAWSLTTFPSSLRFGFDGFAGGILNANVSIPTGSWHDMTVRRSGNTFDLFFDGANVATATTSSPIGTTTLPLLIGKRSDTDGRDFSVDGRIDEVAIWTRALSDSDLAALFNNGQGIELSFVNQAPTASAGGPYTATYGDSLMLDASGSSDPDRDALTYSWTINGHPAAAAGIQPTLTWSQLQALGVTPGATYTVSVAVDDGQGHVVTATDTLLTVNRRDLHVSATGINKTYDGTTVATVTLSDDRVSGDQLTVSYTTAAFADPNAGMGKAVSVSGITISGPDAGNYNLVNDTASTTADILRATPAFSLVPPPVLVAGAPTATLSGTIRAGSLVPPGSVMITINGVSRNAMIDTDGSFSVAFPTAALGAGGYTIDYFYPGSTNFENAQATALLDVTYGVGVLSDQKAAKQAGSTIPIQLALLNAGRDISSAAVSVKAVGIAPLSDPGHLLPAEDAGNSNPDSLFRFQGGAKPFYQYNLKTPKGLSAGTYLFFFEVEGDPLLHAVQFTIK